MINIDQMNDANTICAFIRHGEKDSNNYSLTENGKKKIVELSRLISLLQKDVLIYSSPEPRCVETATIINNIVNDAKSPIRISMVLGKPGIQVKDNVEYTKLIESKKCREVYKEWKNGLCEKAMNTPEYIERSISDFVDETSLDNGLTLYISQSGTVACIGYALGLIDYKADDEDWVDYLNGFVVRK